MGSILDAWLQQQKKEPDYAEMLRQQATNLRTRLEAVGAEPPEPPEPLLLKTLNLLTAPERWQGRKLGELTGLGGEDVGEAVRRIMEAIGVPTEPLFQASIPWFGGRQIDIAPTLPGMIGTVARVFNPLDPLNLLTAGLAAPATAAVRAGTKVATEAAQAAAAPTARAIALQLRAPFTRKVLAQVQPGALLGPIRPAVSKAITAPIRAVAESGIGQAAARRFGTGMAPKYLPGQAVVRRPETLSALDRSIMETIAQIPEEGPRLMEGAELYTRALQERLGAPGTAQELAARMRLETLTLEHLMDASGEAADSAMRRIIGRLSPAENSLMTDWLLEQCSLEALPERLRGVAVAARNLRDQLFSRMQEVGVQVEPRSQYLTRLTKRPYPKEFLDQAGVVAGRHIRAGEVTGDLARATLEEINPHIMDVVVHPDVRDPRIINKLMATAGFDPVLEEDLATIMSTHARRTVRATVYKQYADAAMENYGRSLEEAMQLLNDPAEAVKWGLYRVESSLDGFRFVEVPGGIPQKLPRNIPKNVRVFPREFAQYLNEYTRAVARPEQVRDGISGLYQAWLGWFKRGTTTPLLGYWFRNKEGDVYQSWLAGMRSPRGSHDAGRFLYLWRQGRAGEFVARAPGGQTLTGDQLEAVSKLAGFHRGGLFGAELGRNVPEPGILKAIGKPFRALEEQGRIWVDWHSRLALFLDRFYKGDSIADAITVTKKYLFDYFELTPFEKQVMRSWVPFYTWGRKNIPLQVSQFLQQPGKFTTIQKWSEELGGKGEERPYWLKASMGIGVGGPKGMYVLPRLPYEDLGRLNLQNLLGSLSPMARAPLELATGRYAYSGIPIREEGEEPWRAYLTYFMRQLMPRAYTAYPEAAWEIARAAGAPLGDLPWTEEEYAARRMATTFMPFGLYPKEAAARGAQREELDRLLDQLARLKRRGIQVPTLRELGL